MSTLTSILSNSGTNNGTVSITNLAGTGFVPKDTFSQPQTIASILSNSGINNGNVSISNLIGTGFGHFDATPRKRFVDATGAFRLQGIRPRGWTYLVLSIPGGCIIVFKDTTPWAFSIDSGCGWSIATCPSTWIDNTYTPTSGIESSSTVSYSELNHFSADIKWFNTQSDNFGCGKFLLTLAEGVIVDFVPSVLSVSPYPKICGLTPIYKFGATMLSHGKMWGWGSGCVQNAIYEYDNQFVVDVYLCNN